jgi:hypothetical protein
VDDDRLLALCSMTNTGVNEPEAAARLGGEGLRVMGHQSPLDLIGVPFGVDPLSLDPPTNDLAGYGFGRSAS